MPKLCIDCVYYQAPPGRWAAQSFAKCTHTFSQVSLGPDLVTGQGPRVVINTCETMRNALNACGPNGLLFSPKVSPPTAPLL